MVDNDYTDMEDVVVDEEAIEFNNRNADDQENGDNDNCDNDDDNDDNNNVLYSEVVATKKRKKGTRLKPMTSKKRKSKGMTKRNKKTGTLVTHQSTMILWYVARVTRTLRETQMPRTLTRMQICSRRRCTKEPTQQIGRSTKNGQPGRVIHPIPFTGTSEFFCPNISEIEMKEMIDEHGDVRFHKIFEWMLLTFDGESFYECLSARMRNYMVHSIKLKGWTLCYYCPADGKVIVADDVACFFGCQIARSLRGNPSIACTWSTR
jgi:hypothetical protein